MLYISDLEVYYCNFTFSQMRLFTVLSSQRMLFSKKKVQCTFWRVDREREKMQGERKRRRERERGGGQGRSEKASEWKRKVGRAKGRDTGREKTGSEWERKKGEREDHSKPTNNSHTTKILLSAILGFLRLKIVGIDKSCLDLVEYESPASKTSHDETVHKAFPLRKPLEYTKTHVRICLKGL